MKRNYKKIKAFSLIELSLVIIVVGILISGIIGANTLYQKAQLSTARSLTMSSPVHSIKGLVTWYETSLESSFKTSEGIDGSSLSIWYDNNKQTVFKNNASQSTSTKQPLFVENAFSNGIPGVRFDGSNDTMPFDGSVLVGTSYSIFIVEQKRASLNQQYMLAGSSSTIDTMLYFGYYSSDNLISFVHYGYGVNSYYSNSSLAYNNPKPRIHTGILNAYNSRSIWLNGVSQSLIGTIPTNPLVAWTGANIGLRFTSYNGDIGEIIMFNRVLTTEERQAVESYLGKKFGVNI